MSNNNNYITGLTSFQSGENERYYEAPSGVALGGETFTASALFNIRLAASATRSIWGNQDDATPRNGWAIYMPAGGGDATLRYSVTDASPAEINIDLPLGALSGGSPYLEQWILATMEVDTTANELRAYYNGALAATAALDAGGVLASTTTAKVGVRGDPATEEAGTNLVIAGCAYNVGLLPGGSDTISLHFENVQQARTMASISAIAPSSIADFTNRWDARDAVDPNAPNGTLVDVGNPGDKALTAFPSGRAIWPAAQQAGIAPLTLVSATGAGAPGILGIKNEQFLYTDL